MSLRYRGRQVLLAGSYLLLMTIASSLVLVEGQFGLGMMKKKTTTMTTTSENTNPEKEEKVEDFESISDAELLEAIKELSDMSPEESEELRKELQEMLGDDPETISALDDFINELPNKIEFKDIQSTMKDLVSQEEVTKATMDALKLLGQSSGKWETIWGKQDLILEAVIQSGQINAEDAALFKTDQNAWKKELRYIWDELQNQVSTAAGGGGGGGAGDEL